MRVLFLSPRSSWPHNSGAKLREYHLARALAGSAELTLLAFSADGEALRQGLPFFDKVVAVPPPARYTPWKLALGFAGTRPLPLLNYTTPEMQAALAKELGDGAFDIVQIEGTPMAAYVHQIRAAARPPLLVYDWHNIESDLMRRYGAAARSWPKRLYAARTARLLERTEGDMLASGAAHLVCSAREREQLLDRAPQAQIHVVANGVDTQAFAGEDGARRDRLLFVGIMDYHANIEAAVSFAAEVWPRIHREQPGLRLTIVGANPVPEVKALGALPNVEVTGTVPDLRPYYREALAALVPLKTGGGTRLKILEALAAGVPVVSTAVGAEGLAVVDGEHILIAESPAQWSEALGRLAADPDFACSLVEAGRDLAVRQYDWRVIGEDLRRIFQDLLAARGAR
jgi:glycosyltransferase involved in cell wall biosynthesis